MRKQMIKRSITLLFILSMFFACAISTKVSAKDENDYASKAVEADNLEENGYDIVFCIDNSRSVWSQQEIRNAALRCIGNLAVGSNIRIGGVYFARDIYCELNLTSMSDQAGSEVVLKEFLSRKDQNQGNIDTNIGVALQAARRLLENQDSKRKQIVILFSDGINENLAGSTAYKNSADALTEEQAKLMEGKIDIYCVYLQKNRNNEGYLRQLVNYFNSSNTYDQSRFKKVKESEITTLSDEFAKVFYEVQNGMKHRDIKVDSTGKTTFYVPAIGISRVQIFLKNDMPIEAVLKCEEEDNSEKSVWKDGLNAYISVENPTVGQWELSLSGNDVVSTTGTIAYYVDLKCYTELVDTSGDDGIYKNDEVKLRSVFYNSKGEKVELDSSTEAVGYYKTKNSAGEESIEKLPLQLSDGYYESETFTIDDYGTYTIGANIVYQDFVDLSYSMEESEITGHAPVAKNKSGYFVANKKDGKYSFSIKETSIITDLEKEKLTLVSVIQGNPENTVSVEHKDGYIVVTAQKSGNIEFSLEFSDESGAVSTVTLEGKVRDKVVKVMEDIFTLLLIVIFVVKLINRKAEMKRCKQEIEENKIKIEEIHEDIQKKIKDTKEKYLLDKKAEVNNLREGINMICDDEFVLECFGLAAIAQYDTVRSLDVVACFNKMKTMMRVQQEELNSLEITKNKFKELRQMKTMTDNCIDKAENSLKKLEKVVKEFAEQNPITDADVREAQEKCLEMKEAIEGKIECTLKITCCEKKYRGVMLKNVVQNGYYRLDKDLPIVEIGGDSTTLSETIDNMSKIIVYAYNDKENPENKGVVFRSNKEFQIKEMAENGNYEEYTEYVLQKNVRYCLSTRSGIVEISVE